MKSKAAVRRIVEELKVLYPNARCSLEYKKDYELLFAVRLSAQCTDARVNMVTPELFGEYPGPAELAAANPEHVEDIIRTIGFFRTKARNIIGLSHELCVRFGGEVPADMASLVSLPGVGRKTANVLGAVLWQKQVMPVDTHVFRVSERIGLTTGSKNPLQTERTLERNIPGHLLPVAHHWLILHGRYVCTARSPKCASCGIAPWCRKHAADSRSK